MITVSIGNDLRDFQDVTSQWVHEQLARRRRDNASVCIKITVNEAPLNMILTTPGCAAPASGATSSRVPNPQENKIYGLWDRHGLSKPNFSGGELIAFLQELRRGT